MKKIKIYYAIMNNGDGSVKPFFFRTLKDAQNWEESENPEDQWGEPCFGETTMEFDDDGLLTNPHL